MLNKLRFVLQGILCVVLILLACGEASSQVPKNMLADSNGEWYIESAERASDAKIAELAGRRAIWLRNNTHLIRNDVEFTDGTIEFEIAPFDAGNFVALVFRRESFTNHENIYFRIHRSGLYNALQYAPRINGSSTWQLYPEFNSTIGLPRNQWTRVRVEVAGSKMEVFINGDAKPVLTVPRLRRAVRAGTVGFWARVNDRPVEWAVGISNVSIRPRAGTETDSKPEPSPASSLASWEAVDAGPAESGPKLPGTATTGWKTISAEENGLVNLNRLFTASRGRRTAFVRTSIDSEGSRMARLAIGYSDDIKIYLNGELAYQGINGFESRHPEYMGFVKPEFENVHLKLRPGKNELLLAVTDDQRFGWGFIANLYRDQ